MGTIFEFREVRPEPGSETQWAPFLEVDAAGNAEEGCPPWFRGVASVFEPESDSPLLVIPSALGTAGVRQILDLLDSRQAGRDVAKLAALAQRDLATFRARLVVLREAALQPPLPHRLEAAADALAYTDVLFLCLRDLVE